MTPAREPDRRRPRRRRQEPFRQVIVFGAGALGSWLGARVDAPAVLVARGAHLRALRAGSLTIGGLESDRVPVRAVARMPHPEPRALVLVCVKTYDLAAAARAVAPKLRRDTVVAVAANGLDPDRELAAALERPVVRIVAEFGVSLDAPGTIAFWGGRALLGPGTAEDRVAAQLTTTGLPVDRVESLERVAWEKFVMNCTVNALGAVEGLRNNELASPRWRPLRRALTAEGVAVASASGVALNADLPRRIDDAIARSRNLNSMAQDLRRGKRTEIAALNGRMAELGAAAGVATPVNALLADAVRLRTASASSG